MKRPNRSDYNTPMRAYPGIYQPTSVQDLLNLSGMSARPFYYSGRGVVWGDMNPENVKLFYDYIAYGEHVGDFPEGATDAFYRMAMDADSWAATPFMQNMYELEQRGWQPVPDTNKPDLTVEKNADGEYDAGSLAGGMAAIFASFGRNKDDEKDTTEAWKNALRRHTGREPTKLVGFSYSCIYNNPRCNYACDCDLYYEDY